MGRLKNKANKPKQSTDIVFNKKQRNLISLNRQSKLYYFNSISNSKDTKSFWKQCKPYLLANHSYKHAGEDSKIIFNENDEMILDNESVSEKLISYFSQVVDSLYLYEFPANHRREYADEIKQHFFKIQQSP